MADALQGTWILKDEITATEFEPIATSGDVQIDFDFTVVEGATVFAYGGIIITSIDSMGGFIDLTYVKRGGTSNSTDTVYYYGSGWMLDIYKTIVISSKLAEVTNGDILLAWLKTNATKQELPTNIDITRKAVTLATEGTYCDRDIRANVVLQEKTVAPVAGNYSTEVKADRGYAGLSRVFVDPIKTESQFVSITSPDTTAVTPTTSNTYLTQVFIEPVLQDKTVTPTTSQQVINPDKGFCGLGSVRINASITDVATAAEMDAKLVAANVGKIYRFTGTTDSTYTNGDLYEVVSQ